MKVLVIDNEPNLRTAIRALVKAFCPEVTSIEEAGGVQSGLHKIKNFQPDIILLDVEMDDGTGFDLYAPGKQPFFPAYILLPHIINMRLMLFNSVLLITC